MRNNFLYAIFLILFAALFVSCDRINNSNKALLERESPSYRAAMEDYRSGRLEKAIAGFEKVAEAMLAQGVAY